MIALTQTSKRSGHGESHAPPVRGRDASSRDGRETAILFYEDIPSGWEAQLLLRKPRSDGVPLRVISWKFQMLNSPKLREIAIDDARDAALIMIATNDLDGLPSPLKFALGAIFGRREGAPSVLALASHLSLDGPPESPVADYLRRFAEVLQIPLIHQPLEDLFPDLPKAGSFSLDSSGL